MTVESIKQAIAELPSEQKTSLTAWLVRQDLDDWDRQIEQDFSPGGAGVVLLDEAETDIRQGRLKPMDELLAEVKAKRKGSPR